MNAGSRGRRPGEGLKAKLVMIRNSASCVRSSACMGSLTIFQATYTKAGAV